MNKRLLTVVLLISSIGTVATITQFSASKTAACPKPVFIRDAAAQWTIVNFESLSIEIPYSPDWQVENPECLWEGASYDPSIYKVVASENVHELHFGRPSNNLSSIDLEYSLTVRDASPMDTDVAPESWSCLEEEIETPQEVSIGDTTGWRYFQGGAKWCELVYQFIEDGRVISVTQNLEPKASQSMNDIALSTIDVEMERIITSIHKQEF